MACAGSDVPASEAPRDLCAPGGAAMTETDTTPTLHEVLTRGIERALRDLGVDLVGCTPATLTGPIIRELRDAGITVFMQRKNPGPSRAYGVAPDELPPGVVLTAQRIINYLRPEWDPNDVWD